MTTPPRATATPTRRGRPPGRPRSAKTDSPPGTVALVQAFQDAYAQYTLWLYAPAEFLREARPNPWQDEIYRPDFECAFRALQKTKEAFERLESFLPLLAGQGLTPSKALFMYETVPMAKPFDVEAHAYKAALRNYILKVRPELDPRRIEVSA